MVRHAENLHCHGHIPLCKWLSQLYLRVLLEQIANLLEHDQVGWRSRWWRDYSEIPQVFLLDYSVVS